MEFADAEARKASALKEYEDELRRFKLTEELALTRAEIKAVTKNEEDESEVFVGKEDLLDEIDKT